jgi:hypothetical protein
MTTADIDDGGAPPGKCPAREIGGQDSKNLSAKVVLPIPGGKSRYCYSVFSAAISTLGRDLSRECDSIGRPAGEAGVIAQTKC